MPRATEGAPPIRPKATQMGGEVTHEDLRLTRLEMAMDDHTAALHRLADKGTFVRELCNRVVTVLQKAVETPKSMAIFAAMVLGVVAMLVGVPFTVGNFFSAGQGSCPDPTAHVQPESTP